MQRPHVAALLLLCLVLAGCNRQPRLVPASADSSLVPVDSFAVSVRDAQQRWDAGDGEGAARITASLLVTDLRMRLRDEPRLSWADRARTLLDSLDVGAELADAPCALVASFFSRANPEQGSWPWLFYCASGGIAAQPIEGGNMALLGAASRGLFGETRGVAPGVAALFGRRGAGGQQPVLMVWLADRAGRWRLAQTLGPDSLGGTGTAEFQVRGDTLVDLVSRTWRNIPRFDECATCPHVTWTHRFHWNGPRFERVEDRMQPSPYAAFVQLVQAMVAGDRDAALLHVADPGVLDAATAAGLDVQKGPWRAAPTSDPNARDLVFYRGANEAWRVTFAMRGDDWVVESLEPTTRTID